MSPPIERASSGAPTTSGRCVVCGERRGLVIDRRRDFEVCCCPCGGVYLSPEPAADAVDPSEDPHPESFYRLPARFKVRWLARTHPRLKLLEVGCGDGFFLAAAQRAGYEVEAIEAHPDRASAVARRLGIPVECGLIENTNLAPGRFDIVYHCDLLSHFPDPALALNQMVRLLRPGGVLFFEVGLVGALSPYWYRNMPDHTYPRHRWFFDRKALERLLAAANLRIIRFQRFGLAPQLMYYRTIGPLYRTFMAPLRALRRRRSRDCSDVPGSPPRERPLEGWINNVFRFRVGAIAPPIGPQTTFVLAAAIQEPGA